jgi:Family of unknown function (DUF5678)
VIFSAYRRKILARRFVMATSAMYEVMQQAAGLPLDEKLRVMTVLTEQIRVEANKLSNGHAAKNGHPATNGHTDEKAEAPPSEPDPERVREYVWLKAHRHEYPGQYVALDGDRIVSHGADGRAVLAEARSVGVPYPLMVRIEAADELPFYGGW